MGQPRVGSWRPGLPGVLRSVLWRTRNSAGKQTVRKGVGITLPNISSGIGLQLSRELIASTYRGGDCGRGEERWGEGRVKPNGRLVRVSSARCRVYTSRLSTWSSSRGLRGDLILGPRSRPIITRVYPHHERDYKINQTYMSSQTRCHNLHCSALPLGNPNSPAKKPNPNIKDPPRRVSLPRSRPTASQVSPIQTVSQAI
jgi:hypothetical protein